MRKKRFPAGFAAWLVLCVFCLSAAPAETAVDACGLRGWDFDSGWQYVILGYHPYEADGTKKEGPASTADAIFAAQEDFAPSQIMPELMASTFTTV